MKLDFKKINGLGMVAVCGGHEVAYGAW